jgi:hypothetical protein
MAMIAAVLSVMVASEPIQAATVGKRCVREPKHKYSDTECLELHPQFSPTHNYTE